jgi:hypothetical protein
MGRLIRRQLAVAKIAQQKRAQMPVSHLNLMTRMGHRWVTAICTTSKNSLAISKNLAILARALGPFCVSRKGLFLS